VPYSDVLTREVAWLQTFNDGLPALLAPDGPWEVIQAYWPKSQSNVRKPTLFVMRTKAVFTRFGNQRTDQEHHLTIHCRWPVQTAQNAYAGEADQQNFDTALGLLVTRILGPVQDKTHGGRFISAADTELGHGPLLDVSYGDTERNMSAGCLIASVTYSVNDDQLNN
jgi:hypothetical protein